jgi:hypothetical protein
LKQLQRNGKKYSNALEIYALEKRAMARTKAKEKKKK